MRHNADGFFGWLNGHGATPRVLVAVAHPDDETVGAGGVLARLGEARVVCATDGAPHDRQWWGDPSCASREAYASLRRRELYCALGVAGIPGHRATGFEVADQEASANLAGLARRMADAIAAAQPDVVLTLAYEGGHPDHDAVAFAVHHACALLDTEGRSCPSIIEFPLYHAENEPMVIGRFVPAERAPMQPAPGREVVMRLSERERMGKRRMMECHASQMATLVQFGVDEERFRAAPAYDFGQPPHEGRLNYERFGWAHGAAWRAAAAAALVELGVAAPRDGAMDTEGAG